MQEVQTKSILMQFLRENTSFELIDRGSWFYAVKHAEQEQAERIAFRADMDALPMAETIALPYASQNPGISHKCGHDGHMSVLCGLAAELEHCSLPKSVYLIFQPGEETGSGAYLCRGILHEERISEIYAFHNLSGYPQGTVVYHPDTTQPASEGIKIKLTGKASHAAEPEMGNNPSHAIASIILYAEKLCRCEDNHLLLCTVTGIQMGTGDFGISPGHGELCMTLRSDEEQEMKKLENCIVSFTKDLAAEYGLQMDYQICDYFPETRNNPQCLKKVEQAAALAGIPVVEMDSLWRPSEDFGYYLKECPGALFYLGNGENYTAVHTNEYDFNDRISEPAIEVFRNIVLL